MKKIIFIILLFVTVFGFAQDKWATGGFVDYTGKDWLIWSPYQKNAYLVGFCTGCTASLMYLVDYAEEDVFLQTYLQSFGEQLYLVDVKTFTEKIVINNIIELQMVMDTLIPQYPELQNMYIWKIIFLCLNKGFAGQ